MFKRFFQKQNSNKISKIDYWKKWELYELFDDLHKAETVINNIKNNDEAFINFKNDFIEELHEIEGDNVADFTRVWEWFKSAKEWELFCGDEGSELKTNIFRITDKWKRNQDFINGTKVSLNAEVGVVIEKKSDDDNYGQIRWDTNKENDTEDWCGLFGSFLSSGGEIINQDYQFRFINDDGTMKKSHN